MDYPVTLSEWEARASVENVRDRGLQDFAKLSSASDISDLQFLALRVLWKTNKKSDDFKKTEAKYIDQKYLDQAAVFLQGFRSWEDYLKLNEKKDKAQGRVPDLGTFSLVASFQLQVAEIGENQDGTSNVTISSPVASRTRSNDPNPPSTPTPVGRTTGPSRTLAFRPATPKDDIDSPFPFPSSGFTPAGESPANANNSQPVPPTPDEQIVNTALILFLDALTMHFPGLTQYWTIQRYAFKITCGSQQFEARTDGYLQDKVSGKVRSIIEVKPHRRAKGKVRMQDSAQMVGWIANEDKPANSSTSRCVLPSSIRIIYVPKLTTSRHLLISQDREEIYLTFAEYDDAYVDYIKQRSNPSEKLSLMSMREFGPWKIESREDMEHLSRFLLAFTLRANDDAAQERK